MEGKIRKVSQSPLFQPFVLELKAETIEQARLLFHICNHNKLRDRIIGSPGYTGIGYSEGCAREIGDGVQSLVKAEIQKQGFEL